MPACFHRSDGGELFAGAVLGDGADGKDIDDGVALGALHDVAGNGGAVVHRRRVGHAADGSEAAGRSGARSALDGLGVLKARLAQMDMHVDEAGRDDQSRGVQLAGAGER